MAKQSTKVATVTTSSSKVFIPCCKILNRIESKSVDVTLMVISVIGNTFSQEYRTFAFVTLQQMFKFLLVIHFQFRFSLHSKPRTKTYSSLLLVSCLQLSALLAQVVPVPVQPYSAESWPKAPFISFHLSALCCT